MLLNKTAKQKINILEVKKAIYYARKYHGSQLRQSGEPYYSHPLEVAYKVADHWFTTDVLVASVLHDTIEDTMLSKEMIDYIFGSVIASKVESLTRIKIDQKISAAEMVDLLYIQKKNDLLVIKLFDRIHNMQTLAVKSPDKIRKTAEETVKKFISLSMYLSTIIPNIKTDRKIINLCYKNLPSRKEMLMGLDINLNDNFQLPFPVFQNAEFQILIQQ